MTEEQGHDPAGAPRRQPDRIDAWFCRIASIIVAILLIMSLHHAMQARPADPAANDDDHTRIVG